MFHNKLKDTLELEKIEKEEINSYLQNKYPDYEPNLIVNYNTDPKKIHKNILLDSSANSLTQTIFGATNPPSASVLTGFEGIPNLSTYTGQQFESDMIEVFKSSTLVKKITNATVKNIRTWSELQQLLLNFENKSNHSLHQKLWPTVNGNLPDIYNSINIWNPKPPPPRPPELEDNIIDDIQKRVREKEQENRIANRDKINRGTGDQVRTLDESQEDNNRANEAEELEKQRQKDIESGKQADDDEADNTDVARARTQTKYSFRKSKRICDRCQKR